MSGLLLSETERLRFIDYCRREAESLNGVAEQMKKLPNMEVVIKAYNARRMAYTIVADDLNKMEAMSL